MSVNNHVKADLLLVCVTLLAALGWIFSKESFAQMPPMQFIGVRFMCAAIILALFARRQILTLTWYQWLLGGRVGVLFAVAILVWALGLHNANHVGVGAFLTSLGVLLVPLFRLRSADKPALSWWLSLPVAALGLVCLSLDSQFVFGLGEWLFLLAACIFAYYFASNSDAAAQVPSVCLAMIALSIVGIVALSVSAVTETWVYQLSGEAVGWLLASIFIATSLRFFLQTYAQSLAPVSHTAVIMILEPVWTALLAGLWFAEVMSFVQFLGCGLIFWALLMNRWKALKQFIFR